MVCPMDRMDSQRYEPFKMVSSADPHLVRRALILRKHPSVKTLMGFDRQTLPKMVFAMLLQFSIAALLMWAGQITTRTILWTVVVLLGLTLGPIIAHYGGVVIHEASHDLCAKTPAQNRCIAIFANLIQLVPYAMSFRRHHLTHHVHLGVEGIDNDLAVPWERTSAMRHPLAKVLWLLAFPFVGGLFRSYAQKPDRWEWANIILVIGFDLLLFVLLGPVAFTYLAISAYVSGSLHPVAGHFIHEHYLWDPGQETYSYYGPLNAVTLNLGYHVEHHDFINVPGSNLKKLHALAPEFYQDLVSHRSWTAVLWTFVTDRQLSHASRFARTKKDVRGQVAQTLGNYDARRLEQQPVLGAQ